MLRVIPASHSEAWIIRIGAGGCKVLQLYLQRFHMEGEVLVWPRYKSLHGGDFYGLSCINC